MLAFYSADGTEAILINSNKPVPIAKVALPSNQTDIKAVDSEMSDLLKRAIAAKMPCFASKTKGDRSYSFSYDGKNINLTVSGLIGAEMKPIYKGDLTNYRYAKSNS